MGFEWGAVTVGGISIMTLILTKLKCYAKKNGSCNYGCGFTSKDIFDDDDTEIKTVDLGESVHVMYVKNKHHAHHHVEEEEETDDE